MSQNAVSLKSLATTLALTLALSGGAWAQSSEPTVPAGDAIARKAQLKADEKKADEKKADEKKAQRKADEKKADARKQQMKADDRARRAN